MHRGRLITSVLAGALASIVFATAAHAKTLTLQESQIGSTAAGFEPHECDGPLASPPGPGYDGWHFVAPSNSTFTSITITFSGGVTAGPITQGAPGQSGAGWSGFLDGNHAYIFTTPTGLSIAGGTAEVAEDPQQDFFVLSHTCPGQGNGTASPRPSGGAETGAGGSLGITAMGMGALVAAAGGGIALIVLRRRFSRA